MLIEFTLYADRFLTHNKIIELPETTVELSFHKTAHSFGTLTLTLENGEAEKQYKIGNSPIDVTEMFATAGEVKATVTLSVRGNKARDWQIEPFLVRKIEDGFEAVPEVIALKEKVNTLELAVTELFKLITDNQ